MIGATATIPDAELAAQPRRTPVLLLLVSCGWAVRNYLRSPFLAEMRPLMDVVVALPPGDDDLESELREVGIRVVALPPSALPRGLGTLNGLLVIADNHRLGFWDAHLWQWMIGLDPPWRRLLRRTQIGAAWVLALSPLYQIARRVEAQWFSRVAQRAPIRDLCSSINPDVVLSTNPFDLREIPVSVHALGRNVPAIAALESWDHLTHKGHPIADSSRFIVWGAQMAEDLLRHRPDLRSDRIVTAGSPQFDFHRRDDLTWTRADFFRRVGGDPERPLITYAADTEITFPDEPEIVRQLWSAIERGEIAGRPQLLVRPHPHDVTGRFEALRAQCPGLLITLPWTVNPARHWWFAPALDDLALLSNTLRYTDVSINLAGSMTLDAAIFDKPVVNVAFTTAPDDPRACRVPFSQYGAHYSRVMKWGAARRVTSAEELLQVINMYLEHPELDRSQRHHLVRRLCGQVDGQACRRIARCVVSSVEDISAD